MYPVVRINLAVLLAKKKWKVTDLAKLTGIRYMTLSDMYHEFTERISLEHIDLICKALDCTAGELIEYVPDKSK
jgi:putative transcriptional regulator